ncbi:hypothetical protein C8F01DRAFT_1233117 [Mycena amicta]|nr:hypothetical protein C8F01DRAFT_1233117 [Mycena amicta]
MANKRPTAVSNRYQSYQRHGPFCSSLPRQVVARCSSHSASEYHSLKPRLGVCVIETAFVFTIRSAIRHFLWRFCDQAQTTSGIAIRVKARGSGSARNGSVKAGDESEVYEDDEDVLGYVGLGYQPTSSLSSLYPTLRDPTSTAEVWRMVVAKAHRRQETLPSHTSRTPGSSTTRPWHFGPSACSADAVEARWIYRSQEDVVGGGAGIGVSQDCECEGRLSAE